MTQPPMADGVPGRQHLTGYRLRGYDHAIATLCAARDSRQLTNADVARRIGIDRASVSRWLGGVNQPYGGRLVELAGALGYDLALVPREPDSSGAADPHCVYPDGVCTCGEPEGHRDPSISPESAEDRPVVAQPTPELIQQAAAIRGGRIR